MLTPQENEELICVGCGKCPNELTEYVNVAREGRLSPDEYVRRREGTYNPRNGHFLCTLCYVEAGMPSSPRGWKAP